MKFKVGDIIRYDLDGLLPGNMYIITNVDSECYTIEDMVGVNFEQIYGISFIEKRFILITDILSDIINYKLSGLHLVVYIDPFVNYYTLYDFNYGRTFSGYLSELVDNNSELATDIFTEQ